MSAGGQIDWDSVAPRANAGAAPGGVNWDSVAPRANPEAQHVQAHPLKGQNFGDWLSEELLGPVVNAASQLGRGIQGLGHPEQRPLAESVRDLVQGGMQITAPFAYGLNREQAPAEPPTAGAPSAGAVGTALKGAATGAVKAIPKALETSILKYTGLPQITRGAYQGAKEALQARAGAVPPVVDPLLDKIAQGFGVKDFSSLGAEQQATVREIGARMTGGQAAATAPATPPAYVPRPPEYYGVKPAETPPQAPQAAPAATPPVTAIQPNGGPLRPPLATPQAAAPPAPPVETAPAATAEPIAPEPAPAATPEPPQPKPASIGAIKANAQAKSQRYADAIAAWAKDMGMSPKAIADQWEAASPEIKGQIYLQLKSKGYLGASETIPRSSAQGIVDALQAKAATIKPANGFSLGAMKGTASNGTVTPGGINAETPVEPAATTEGPAVPRASAPSAGPITGGEQTQILIPGEDRTLQARYEVRELGDVQPSHNGQTFSPNERYALHNERDYSQPENQQRVIQNSSEERFNPRYHITDNPDATNGPIVIDERGNALGGNSRAMILQRVYQANKAGAQSYRDLLQNRAQSFGIDPATVQGMKQPVLVRVVPDQELQSLPGGSAWAVRKTNVSGTAALSATERSVADAGQLSPDSMGHIAAAIEQAGPDATLNDALTGQSGTRIVNRLINDGFFSEQERPALMDGKTGALTQVAKDRISKALLGGFFKDSDQLARTAPAIRAKLERIAAPLAKVAGDPNWNLTPTVKEAVDLLEYAQAHGIKHIPDVTAQTGLFGTQEWSPQAVKMADALQSAKPNDLVSAARRYAADKEPTMFGETSPAESFAMHFH